MEVRRERPEDRPAVRAVNQQAFGQPQEEAIVDALRIIAVLILHPYHRRRGAEWAAVPPVFCHD